MEERWTYWETVNLNEPRKIVMSQQQSHLRNTVDDDISSEVSMLTR